MNARVVSGMVPPDKLEEAIELWRNTVALSVPQRKGFKNAWLLVDRRTGRVMSLGLWETEPDVQDTSQWNLEQIDKFTGLFTAPPTVEEHFEVAVQV